MALPSAFDRNLRFCIPVHQRGTFDRAIAALAPGFLEYPVTGEVFQSKVACKTRLQAFALSQGFAVVIGKSNKDGTPFVEFLCVHHGTKARVESAGEEDLGLPPSTAPPRLEDAVTKRSRGKTLDYLALHTGKASKKTRPEEGPEE
jgi:hypothetical protein